MQLNGSTLEPVKESTGTNSTDKPDGDNEYASEEEDSNVNQHSASSISHMPPAQGESHGSRNEGNAGKPKKNSYFKYKLTGEDVWHRARAHGRQPKATGTYNDWLNVQHLDDGRDLCLNWNHVQDWDVTPNESEEERSDLPNENILIALDCDRKAEIAAAKLKELKNLEENDVFDIVPFDLSCFMFMAP